MTATWRDTARSVGARPMEIYRISSAFEHDDLKQALAFQGELARIPAALDARFRGQKRASKAENGLEDGYISD